MPDDDIAAALQAQVREAIEVHRPLAVRGGGSKAFYGHAVEGEPLEVSAHRGIVRYAPTELVITARAGTPLTEIEATLAEQDQMLAFEPPAFSEAATLGGTVACNLSGPRRAHAGAARDFVLGTQVLNGKAELLQFGGEVMKNVAGYDVSRLMCGAQGTLGVLLEVSLKVLPKPEQETTVSLQLNEEQALRRMHFLAQQPLPLSASCYDGDELHLRLSGAPGAVEAARKFIGGEEQRNADSFWSRLREHRHGFFADARPLWRLSLASDKPCLPLPGKWLYEWGGALRWLKSDAPAAQVRSRAAAAGGHATLFRGANRDAGVFHPLDEPLLQLHRRLKQAFDPHGILNPGRLYPDL